MEIRFCFRGGVYCLQIGKETPWFQSVDCFCFMQLWFDDMGVSDAKILFSM